MIVGVLHGPLHPPGGLLSPRGSEHLGGPTQQVLPGARVGHSPGRHPLCLPALGISPHRPVRDSREPEGPRVLLVPGTLPRLPDGRFSPALDGPPILCLSPISAGPQGAAQAAQGQSPPNPDCPGVAQAALVHHSPRALGGHPDHSPVVARPHYSGARQALSPRPAISPSHGVAAAWLIQSELSCSSPVQQVLLGSRKPSTRSTYLAKWKHFSCWCAPRGTAPSQAPVPIILDYLLSLKPQGLAISSLKVHLAAISAFHPGKSGHSLFQPHGQQVPQGVRATVPTSLSSGPYMGPQPHDNQAHGGPIRAYGHLLAPVPLLEDCLPGSHHLGEAHI
ncbi:uncharacterized protein RBU57_000956 [Macrochelys suwanniensis]